MSLSIKPISSCAAVIWLVCALGAVAAEEKAPDDAKAVDGLRIRLRILPVDKAKIEKGKDEKGKKLPSHCEVVLENVGDSDLNVQLGFSLANGKSHHPAAVRLIALSKGSNARTLEYAAIPGAAGRVDPFIVPLLSGSSYTFRCRFDDYADSETGDRIDLAAKDFRIAAELTGEAVTATNSDVEGLTLMPYWQGKARSNEVELSIAKKPSDQ